MTTRSGTDISYDIGVCLLQALPCWCVFLHILKHFSTCRLESSEHPRETQTSDIWQLWMDIAETVHTGEPFCLEWFKV